MKQAAPTRKAKDYTRCVLGFEPDDCLRENCKYFERSSGICTYAAEIRGKGREKGKEKDYGKQKSAAI